MLDLVPWPAVPAFTAQIDARRQLSLAVLSADLAGARPVCQPSVPPPLPTREGRSLPEVPPC